ncbi:LOW QUALITY PROTEIN: recQ-mediated genome instability protein 1-like [Chenopodium quinoa]|uniref:LOW QUALITY PROTEIN: recQ-mediated genome instability protein 1-like n=1 Tax=Chenopodium quinoa TaxID=63459 RepID=UPI000B775814|nr:LOW QUALITY PROTEIN: recQ-mediated genome instability protein 1-like [Chenopodium quinoa]
MSRRRLRTVYTSDEDEDVPQQPPLHENLTPQPPQQQQQPPQQHVNERMTEEDDIETPSPDPIPNINSVTLNSTTTTTSTTAATTAVSEHPSLQVSGEDFMDVSDNLSPPPVVTASFAASGCPVNDHLRRMGVNLRREWLDSCKLGLQNTVPGFVNFDVETKAKLCFGQILNSDMNYSGAGILPENVKDLHLVDLTGPFVLQVDEVLNISCPLKERYKNAPSGHKRCLKLSMTDGVQRVFGMEYRPIKSLEALAPAGFKVAIRDVNVRRGILMLVPEVLEILGGSVEELEAARQRLVQEVNKPPRGKRTRNGIVPPLSARATRAAWPQNDVSNEAMPLDDANHVSGNTTTSMLHAATQFRGNTLGVDPSSRIRQVPLAGRTVTELPSERSDQHSLSRDSAQVYISRETAQLYNSVEAGVLPSSRETTEPFNSRVSSEHLISRETAHCSITINAQKFPTAAEGSEQPPARQSTGINPVSAIAIENEDALMLDYMEHPFILSGEKELPFIYLASLSAKWAAVQGNQPSVRGKIKCILTGVNRFRYKGRSTFELQVYVEDGSLISEIFIHHNVVQKAIGYSPEEVNAALSSSNEKVVGDLKSKLNQFQLFLMNFEGTMLVEMNETSTYPIALEMNQNCPASDALLLLKRLKPASSGPMSQNSQLDVINLSP